MVDNVLVRYDVVVVRRYLWTRIPAPAAVEAVVRALHRCDAWRAKLVA